MKKKCPLIGKPCIEHACEFYTHIAGMNPQTGAQIDEFKCAIVFLPILLVENASVSRQTKAAVESARNVFVKALPPEIQGRIASDERPKLNGD